MSLCRLYSYKFDVFQEQRFTFSESESDANYPPPVSFKWAGQEHELDNRIMGLVERNKKTAMFAKMR